mgnify:CR=1 FL=1
MISQKEKTTHFKFIISSIIFFLLIVNSLFAQIYTPVRWQMSSSIVNANEVDLIFTATIDEHWHLYSQDIPMAPPATTFNFEAHEGYEIIGDVNETESISEYDPNFDMVLKYFSEEATFTQRIQLNSTDKTEIKGFINFMSCDDTQCLPPSDEEFSFVFNDNGITLVEEEAATLSSDEPKESFISFFFVAFFFGLAAILTPCVFPMIPMTVSFFMKDSENKAKGRLQATVYGLSIIAIYVFIGSILAVVAGPGIANWLSTHWLPNLLFFSIFMLFAASFFGAFEIVMPYWLVNKSTANEDRGGILGSIFMALLWCLFPFHAQDP